MVRIARPLETAGAKRKLSEESMESRSSTVNERDEVAADLQNEIIHHHTLEADLFSAEKEKATLEDAIEYKMSEIDAMKEQISTLEARQNDKANRSIS